MEALNFLRQADPDLRSGFVKMYQHSHPRDAAVCLAVLNAAQGAPKFVLPKGGRIFNDKLRGLPEDLHLPFPVIVIEYESSGVDGAVEVAFGRDACIPATKRIVVAQEVSGCVHVHLLCYMSHGGVSAWTMMPYIAAICRDEANEVPPMADKFNGDDYINRLAMVPVATGSLAAAVIGPDWRTNAYYDMLDECNAVLELVEALSCRNVSHEALPARKLNKGAAKRGALPFDEYRVLTVKAAVSGKSGGMVFDHRSPREHLRRGHIRRHPTAGNIWVNSCVVNAGTDGKVTTAYDLRRAA